jgi:hypothetical protein
MVLPVPIIVATEFDALQQKVGGGHGTQSEDATQHHRQIEKLVDLGPNEAQSPNNNS